mmetsp:Transcript_52511/g.64329  ORF Transcript_52511/g.64329 Transcript_52511/m.64329 type:complete len:102 (+) Transcript_52511:96-401(+)
MSFNTEMTSEERNKFFNDRFKSKKKIDGSSLMNENCSESSKMVQECMKKNNNNMNPCYNYWRQHLICKKQYRNQNILKIDAPKPPKAIQETYKHTGSIKTD